MNSPSYTLRLAAVVVALGNSLGCSKDTTSSAQPVIEPSLWVSTNDQIGVGFSLEEHDAKLSGVAWLRDPDRGTWMYNGAIKGTHTGSSLAWSVGLVTVKAKLAAGHIKGTMTYAAAGGEPEQSFPFELAQEER